MIEYCDKCGWIKQQCQCEKPMTNADRIRSMTDEELAKLIDNHLDYFNCHMCDRYYKSSGCERKHCNDYILKWLQKEIK